MMLSDKVAIITGGGGGIGEATALLFAEQGANVVVQDVALEAAQQVAQAIADRGGEAVATGGNVTVKADCEARLLIVSVPRKSRMEWAKRPR